MNNLMKARILALALMCAASSAFAQTTASQTYKVIVPESIYVGSPTAVELTHDKSSNNQVFPDQTWVVRGNSTKGVNVNFAVASPFTHTVDSSFKVDTQLDLSVGSKQGPATWTVSKATDKTNHSGSDLDANVTAVSNGVGRANMILKVTFLSPEWGTYAAGDYTTTVVGTVAVNN